MLAFILLLLTWFSTPAHAFDVEEFDQDFGEWEYSPQHIGRTTTDGWAIVSNNSEKAARNSVTGTKYTYYWKLVRTVDLTAAKDPMLDVKLHYKGVGYDYAKVQIGPVGASRLSDFTDLWAATEGTSSPQELSLDLSEWAGEVVTLRVLLRKPYGTVATRVGLYVHRIGVTVSQSWDAIPDDPSLLSVGAFNIQVFGRSKMDKPDVPEVLVDTARRWDLLLVQEIRDSSGVAILDLHEQLEAETGEDIGLVLSDRLGRTISKEQYAFFYRTSKLTVKDAYHYNDGIEPDLDTFQREPYVVWFETVDGKHDFAAIPLHADPDEAPQELDELTYVIEDVADNWSETDVVVLGDFNAGCNYVRASEWASVGLWTDPDLSWWIDGSVDTTTTSTECPYDRIVTGGAISSRVAPESAVVFPFDEAFGLGPTLTRQVSDHYPVEVILDWER